ncbi:MAG TPA: YbhB/YbcL family Raf kinase inhibitor-like protein, partial [Caulobacteraceae bacterium]
PSPEGMVQGHNDRGEWGWVGPRPPSGVHHYHVQVFALDAPLEAAPGASLSQITGALKDHALAEGELIATYAAPR